MTDTVRPKRGDPMRAEADWCDRFDRWQFEGDSPEISVAGPFDRALTILSWAIGPFAILYLGAHFVWALTK